VTSATLQAGPRQGFLGALNTRGHRIALNTFIVVVLAHWAEHVTQAIQIYALHWPRPKAKGLLGYFYPWLITSEWLHYGFALVMLIGLILLRPGFVGRARTWWSVALGIQVWHHLEHFLLLLQASTHHNFFGKPVPTSFLQLVFPRVELHLFYNTIVTIPMVVAMVYHLRPNTVERSLMACTCAPAAANA
jgi:hypothetical protein